jgi:DNA-binding transcriptional LysR family regulator
VTGLVRLSVPVIFGRLHLAPILGRLLAAHPALKLDLLLSDARHDLISDGIDLAIRVGTISDSTLIARRLGAVTLHAVASTSYLAARGTPLHPQELSSHDCLLLTQSSLGGVWIFAGPEGPVSVPVKARLRSDSSDAIRQFVVQGYGIAILPSGYFAAELAAGEVNILLAGWALPPMPVHLVYASRRNLAPRLRAVMDFLQSEFLGSRMLAESE